MSREHTSFSNSWKKSPPEKVKSFLFVFKKARILSLLKKKKAPKIPNNPRPDSLNMAKKGRIEQGRRAKKKEGQKAGKEGWEAKRRMEEKKRQRRVEICRCKRRAKRKQREVPRSPKNFRESQGRWGMVLIEDAALLLRVLVLRAPHAYLVQVIVLTGTYLTDFGNC